jgi:hypothetical protein
MYWRALTWLSLSSSSPSHYVGVQLCSAPNGHRYGATDAAAVRQLHTSFSLLSSGVGLIFRFGAYEANGYCQQVRL